MPYLTQLLRKIGPKGMFTASKGAFMTSLRKCPHCGGSNVARSRRKPIERLLLWIKPYRCSGCNHRFFSFLPH